MPTSNRRNPRRPAHCLAFALTIVGIVRGGNALAIDTPQHPTASTPALSPAEAQKHFVVDPGFEMRLFAAEPDIINPVAMSWDERGRLWVIELFQYPEKAAPGTRGKDRIKILDDTNNDGRADKVTVFAEGLDLATGIVIGNGGAYVGQAPELLFLQDTNGDDIADKRTVLLTGFALRDTHETVNGFTWGPDGWIYFTHGVFNYSNVRAPGQEETEGNPFDAAIARYHPLRKKFEIFADGTSNPWGLDFDRTGNAFVSACVIDHLFHMSPGGVYARQAGSPGWKYGYDLLPSIVDHRHFRAAYAGVQILSSDQFPAKYQGNIVMGNIHGNSINRDRLIPVGSSWKGEDEPDLVKTDDGWFRPVSEQIGPDGALWIADWYDKYPCYQNALADPKGVDRKLGRIWRLVYTGDKPGAPRPSGRANRPNLRAMKSADLVPLLSHPNIWQRKTARRLLGERRDATVAAAVTQVARTGKTLEARLEGLWSLHAGGLLTESLLDELAGDKEPGIRTWVARLTGERNTEAGADERAVGAAARLLRLSADSDPTVRAGVAVGAFKMVNRDVDAAIALLSEQNNTAEDRLLSLLIWRALEPRVATAAKFTSNWLENKGEKHLPFSAKIAENATRRLLESDNAQTQEAAVLLAGRLAQKDAKLALGVLAGFEKGSVGGTVVKTKSAYALLATLQKRKEPEITEAALRVGARWGEKVAQTKLLGRIKSRSKVVPDATRLQAIEIAASANVPGAESAMLTALQSPNPEVVRAAIRALAKVGGTGTAKALLGTYRNLPTNVRPTALETLAARPAWAIELLSAVGKKKLPMADLSAPVQRVLRESKDEAVKKLAADLLGTTRQSSEERIALIEEKRRMVMNGPVDFADGKLQAERTCLLCHKFLGQGADVGPDLTGVGRSTLQALLTNVIDPNQVIGKGYEQVTVTTKDGRLISGRLIEDTPTRVTLAGMNVRETIARNQVQSLDVSDVSAMPEGLEGLPDENFRNLIWYIFAPPEDPANRIRVTPSDKKLGISVRDRKGNWFPLFDYVTDPAFRPYIHPLHDRQGKIALTEDKPGDHVWQHGIFTGLHKVNGVDFWSEKAGKQHFVELLDLEQEPDRVAWRSATDWVGPDGTKLLREEQSIAVLAPQDSDGYEIDFQWRLVAQKAPIKISKYDYGGFSVRMPHDPKHNHLNNNGETDKATSEKNARWTTVERAFGGDTFGIAVLDHPGNPLHPAKWRVDFHGLINPSPSLQGDWGMEPGQRRTFRYRVVVFKGQANKAKLDAAWDKYARTATAEGN